MTLNPQDHRTVELSQVLADTLYASWNDAELMLGRWNTGGSAMLDADVQADFPGLTKQDVIDFMTAIGVFRDALGNFPSDQIVNVAKMMR